jgi:uncharacterized phage protein gp47/JayE
MAFKFQSAQTILNNLLRTYRLSLIEQGIADPDVSPGTEAYIMFNSVATHIAGLNENLQYASESKMPDAAVGDDLNRLAAVFGLNRKVAIGSTGYIDLDLIDNVASAIIPTGQELSDEAGQRFAIAVGGTYNDGDRIRLTSVNTGNSVNIVAGSKLKFISPPSGCKLLQTVSVDFEGGAEAESDDDLRNRLLDKLKSYPGSGNWAHIKLLAEESYPNIQAYIYPCFNGPGTVKVAVCEPPTATDKTRNVDTTLVNTVIKPYIEGNLPGYAELNVTTVQNVNSDVSIYLSLSEENGWKDITPFPLAYSGGYAYVSAVVSESNITVYSNSAPVAGVSRIAFVDSNFNIYRSRVESYTGSGPYVLTLSDGLPGIAINDWIMPDSDNLEKYVQALRDVFADLGPGEITNVAGLLPRALRKPKVTLDNPSAISDPVTKFLISTGDEVLGATFAYRSITTPSVPASVTLPPNILIPRKLAFYPSV